MLTAGSKLTHTAQYVRCKYLQLYMLYAVHVLIAELLYHMPLQLDSCTWLVFNIIGQFFFFFFLFYKVQKE